MTRHIVRSPHKLGDVFPSAWTMGGRTLQTNCFLPYYVPDLISERDNPVFATPQPPATAIREEQKDQYRRYNAH